MDRTLEPATTTERSSSRTQTRAPSIITYGLALGWLILPALQYVGTVQRTKIQLGASFERGSWMGTLAMLDLTPLYLLLLAATLLFGAARVLARKREA